MLKFLTNLDTSSTKKLKLSPLNTHQNHTNHVVHNLFNVCSISSNHLMFKLQRPRIQNMQFTLHISDTTVTLKQSQGHQTYHDNVIMYTPSKVIIMQSLKNLALTVSEKKTNIKVYLP